MRIFHDGKDAFTGGSSSKAVAEVGESVFVQGTGEQNA